MRSYEAARTLSSFLGFCAWCVIIGGVIFALMGATAAAEMGNRFGGGASGLAVFSGLLPGAGVGLVGFVLLAMVQYGRAAVNSAEYAQQSLAISREQLEISKQALKQGSMKKEGYADLQAVKEEMQSGAGFEDLSSTENEIGTPTEAESDIDSANGADRVIEHRGRKIGQFGPVFRVGQEAFMSVDAAKAAIDKMIAEDGTTYDINGQQLTQLADGTFILDDRTFASLDAVKNHLKTKSLAARLGGVSRL